MRTFLQLLLFPDECTRFLNYSETPHEISVVAPRDVIQQLEPVATVDESTWICMQICKDANFACAVVMHGG